MQYRMARLVGCACHGKFYAVWAPSLLRFILLLKHIFIKQYISLTGYNTTECTINVSKAVATAYILDPLKTRKMRVNPLTYIIIFAERMKIPSDSRQ